MKTQERICRLCFVICDNYKAIDEDTKYVLGILLRKIEIVAIQEPVMCGNCEVILSKCFDFKATCLYTHNYLVPFVNKDGVKLNLKDIYMSKNKSDNSALEDQSICGFCLNPVENSATVALDVVMRDIMLEKTEQCFPELDFSIIEEPVICVTCHGSLDKYFRFVTNILIVEDKIRKYRKTLNISNKSEINLSSLLHFILKEVMNDVDGNGRVKFKLEQPSCDYIESINKEIDYKYNSSMNTNDDHEIESNETEAIKPSGLSCENNTIELKEEPLVQVECVKMLLEEEIDTITEKIITRLVSGIDVNGGDITKFEKPSCDHKESVKKEVEDKCNGSLNIDDLKYDNDQKLTPKNIFDLEVDTIKTEAPYCGKNSIEFKEEPFVEDQKILLDEEIDIKTDDLDFNRFEEDDVMTPPGIPTRLNGNWKYLMSNFKEKPSHIKQTRRKKNNSMNKHKLSSQVTYSCDICSFQTKYKTCLKKHLLVHKNPSELTMYKCDYCSFMTIHKNNFKMHVLRHKDPSERTVYKCDSCEFQTRHKSSLEEHSINHREPSEVTMYKCGSCTYQTQHKCYLNKHTQVHKCFPEVDIYNCDSCAFFTKNKESLKRHLLLHNPYEVKMYDSDSRLYRINDKYALKTHTEPSEVAMNNFDACQAKHTFKKYLVKHKDPASITMYQCDSCTYQTKHTSCLKSHLLKHKDPSEVTMYKCDSCSFQTLSNIRLKRHFLLHNPSGTTMYKCDLCTHQTTRKCDLRMHVLRHMDPSKLTLYKCATCIYQTKKKELPNKTHADA